MENINRILDNAEKIRILTGEVPFKEESGELSRRIGVCCEVERDGKLHTYMQNFESDIENYLGISFLAQRRAKKFSDKLETFIYQAGFARTK